MRTEDTLSTTMAQLQKRGYTCDFNFCSGHIECNSLKLKLHPEDFEVSPEGDVIPSKLAKNLDRLGLLKK